MKKIFLFASALVFSLATMAQTGDAQAPTVKPEDVSKFNEEVHDFGVVKQGIPVTYAFVIKNISNKPLVVENSWASCGCTTPEKIVEPILPGASAQLKVQYNAANAGPINKDVYVQFAGVTGPKTIKITGEVKNEADYEAWIKAHPPVKEKTTKVKATPVKATN